MVGYGIIPAASFKSPILLFMARVTALIISPAPGATMTALRVVREPTGGWIAQTVLDAPDSYRARFFYGQSLFESGRRREGETHLRLAIRLNQMKAEVSFGHGHGSPSTVTLAGTLGVLEK